MKLFGPLLLSLSALSAAAAPPSVDKLPEVTKIVNSMKGPDKLQCSFYPQRNDRFPAPGEPLDPRATDLFQQMVNRIFGSTNSLRLRSSSQDGFVTVIEYKTVFLESRMVRWTYENRRYSDPQSLMAFIIAHEIGHVIYDCYAEENGYSPNGNPILYRDTYEGKWPFGHWERKGNLLGHIEVDVFALALMKEMGMSPPVDGPAYLDSIAKGVKPEIQALRQATFKATVAALWPALLEQSSPTVLR